MSNANKNRRSKTISMANANGKFDKWWNRQSAQFKGIKKAPVKELFFMGLKHNLTIKD